MEEAGQTGQESSAPAWKINHRRGAGGKDGRTEEKEDCGRLQASARPPPTHSKVAPARPVQDGRGRRWNIVQRRNEAGINICLFETQELYLSRTHAGFTVTKSGNNLK